MVIFGPAWLGCLIMRINHRRKRTKTIATAIKVYYLQADYCHYPTCVSVNVCKSCMLHNENAIRAQCHLISSKKQQQQQQIIGSLVASNACTKVNFFFLAPTIALRSLIARLHNNNNNKRSYLVVAMSLIGSGKMVV